MDKSLITLIDTVKFDLFKIATRHVRDGRNFVISPVSFMCGSMLCYMASNDAAKENLEQALRTQEIMGPNSAHVMELFSHMLRKLQGKSCNTPQEISSATPQEAETVMQESIICDPEEKMVFYGVVVEKMQLFMANGLFVNANMLLDPEFCAAAEMQLNVVVSKCALMDDINIALDQINTWAETSTSGNIHDIVPMDALTSLCDAVMINALYFTAPWSEKFMKSHTQSKTFYCSEDVDQEVAMMSLNGHFSYYEDDNLRMQYLEMCLSAGDASMLFVLPRDKDGLDTLVDRLSPTSIRDWAKSATRSQEIHVEIPKFRIESEFDMKDLMKDMGITEVFQEYRGLEKITLENNRPVVVSGAFFKTSVDINENGVNSAEGLSPVIEMHSDSPGHPQPVLFIANHPFMFALRHNPTNVIILLGKVEHTA